MVYRFGACVLDPQRHRLQRGGQPVRLRPKAFEVLLYFLTHPDHTVLKQELYTQVWPEQFISEATLESTVRAVRQAIGDSGRAQQLIQTVHGYGYRFVAAVEELSDFPVEIDAQGPEVLQGTIAAPQQNPSLATPLPSVYGSGDEPEAHVEWDGRPQAERPMPDSSGPPGEWKLVTVLCCAPATTAEGGALQEAEARYHRLLSLYALAQPVMQRYGGTLQPVLGDHLLAVFGIPVAQEDHAHRAVLAALDLQRQVWEGRIGVKPPKGDILGLRIGLSTGQVAVGGMGHFPGESPVVVGDTVMQAMMLQARAAPGEVLCSDSTPHLVQGAVRFTAVEPVPVVGELIPIPAHRILGPYMRACLLGRWEQRLRMPFIGRQRQLTTLRALMAQVQEGQGQVVGVIGEPGVGKSRLCYEFIRGIVASQWFILETQGITYGQAMPYLPIIDLLKGYFLLGAHDDRPTVTEKVTSKLFSCDDTLKPSVPAFLALFEVPVEDPQWQVLEAYQRRQRTLEAVKRLLLWECQGQPLLLIVENLHWIDTETQAVLDLLIESLPAARLLLLTTYRPEYQHRWGSKTSYTQLRLDPLPRDSAHALLNSLLGDDAALDPVKQRLRERTQGNPFFMEESVRMLVEMQDLVGGPGAYRVAKPPLSLQVPATVQAVLAARIDRLPVEEKHLLQCAAVVGRNASFALLQAIAQIPEDELHHSLAHLQSAELLYETSLFPEPAYTFKHALTQEVAYGSLLQARRCALHARMVTAIETLYAPQLAEHVDRMAYHALQGEVWDQAVAYCHQAGDKAMARSAHREAVGYFEQALGALLHVPETRGTLEQAIDLRLALRSALYPSGDHERILSYLREAERLAEALDDPRRLGQVSVFLFNHLQREGTYDQALAVAQRALALAMASGDAGLQGLANLRLGFAYHAQGNYRRAIDCLGQTSAVLDGARRHERFGMVYLPAVECRAYLAACHAELGTFAEGRAFGEEGVRIAEAVNHPTSLMCACWGIGLLSLRQGDLSRAIPRLEQAVDLCRETDLPAWYPLAAATLGEAYTLCGRLADAVPLLTQGLEQATAIGRGDIQTRCHLSLGEAQLRAGGLEEAQALTQEALALARAHWERGCEAYALRLLGEIAAHRHPSEVEPAEGHYRQAIVLTRELGMRPLMAHCHRGVGTLYVMMGRREQACAELSAAIELYRSMDMTFWLPQAEAALAPLSA